MPETTNASNLGAGQPISASLANGVSESSTKRTKWWKRPLGTLALLAALICGCHDVEFVPIRDAASDAADSASDPTVEETATVEVGADGDVPVDLCRGVVGGGPFDTVRGAFNCATDTDCQLLQGGAATFSCVASTPADVCQVAEGDPCLFAFQSQAAFTWCGGNQPGCVVVPNTTTCRSGLGPCPHPSALVCSGDMLSLGCVLDQPIFVDCAAYGAGCDDGCSACVGISEGGACGTVLQLEFLDDVGTPETRAILLLCEPGLTCQGETSTALGTCGR